MSSYTDPTHPKLTDDVEGHDIEARGFVPNEDDTGSHLARSGRLSPDQQQAEDDTEGHAVRESG